MQMQEYDTRGHYHAYTWRGDGRDLQREGERRPGHPKFPSSPLPPMRTCDWLLKPASRIAETFYDGESAIRWLANQYQELADEMSPLDGVGLSFRLTNAKNSLAGGMNVQWGFYLRGAMYASVGLVRCPNLHPPAHPCPLTSQAGGGPEVGTNGAAMGRAAVPSPMRAGGMV